MTSSQQKIIGLMFAAMLCSLVEVAGIAASLTDSVNGGCPPGVMCAQVTRTLSVFSYEYDARFLSREQFNMYRAALVGLAAVAQLSCVLMVVKLVREQELIKTNENIS